MKEETFPICHYFPSALKISIGYENWKEIKEFVADCRCILRPVIRRPCRPVLSITMSSSLQCHCAGITYNRKTARWQRNDNGTVVNNCRIALPQLASDCYRSQTMNGATRENTSRSKTQRLLMFTLYPTAIDATRARYDFGTCYAYNLVIWPLWKSRKFREHLLWFFGAECTRHWSARDDCFRPTEGVTLSFPKTPICFVRDRVSISQADERYTYHDSEYVQRRFQFPSGYWNVSSPISNYSIELSSKSRSLTHVPIESYIYASVSECLVRRSSQKQGCWIGKPRRNAECSRTWSTIRIYPGVSRLLYTEYLTNFAREYPSRNLGSVLRPAFVVDIWWIIII